MNANLTAPLTKATLIQIEAQAGAREALRRFLVDGRDVVAETEPATEHWFALSVPEEPRFAVFDTFADAAGRQAHFEGKVAHALAENADRLVQGGWTDGVLENVAHYDVVAATSRRPGAAALAGYIPLTAAPGQAEALAALLTTGRDLVAQTEPGTLFWLALQREDAPNAFAIVDLFKDSAAVDAHFAGQVAAALKAHADTLVEGGWNAVVSNVYSFAVDAAK